MFRRLIGAWGPKRGAAFALLLPVLLGLAVTLVVLGNRQSTTPLRLDVTQGKVPAADGAGDAAIDGGVGDGALRGSDGGAGSSGGVGSLGGVGGAGSAGDFVGGGFGGFGGLAGGFGAGGFGVGSTAAGASAEAPATTGGIGGGVDLGPTGSLRAGAGARGTPGPADGASGPEPAGSGPASGGRGPGSAVDVSPGPAAPSSSPDAAGRSGDTSTSTSTSTSTTVAPATTSTTTATPKRGLTRSSDVEAEVVPLTNADRSAGGLGALSRSGCLDAVAADYAERMARTAVLAHNPGAGPAIHGCRANSTWGDNVGTAGPCSASLLEEKWMASPTHRANILTSAFTQIGVGVWTDAQGSCWVQVLFSS